VSIEPVVEPTQEIDPQAKALFLTHARRLWLILGAFSIAAGNALQQIFTICSPNLIVSFGLSVVLLIVSMIMCEAVSRHLLRDPKSMVILNALAIPIASVAPLFLTGLLVAGPRAMDIVEEQMCGVSFSVGFMYLGAIGWGFIVRIRRRQAFVQQPI
jgi:hypothetical protein